MSNLTLQTARGNELRELTIIYERLDRADGSARFGFGNTKAMASVSGPIEARLAAEQASRATFEVIVRPLSNVPGTESKSIASAIRSMLTPSLILTHNPRTLIQLVVQSLVPNLTSGYYPSLVAAQINASTLALLSAGSIPMRGVVCAAAVGRLSSNSQHHRSTGSFPSLLLDPSEDELPSLQGGGCFAFMFAARNAADDSSAAVPSCETVWSHWQSTASTHESEITQARELAKIGAAEVWKAVKRSITAPGTTQPRVDSAALADQSHKTSGDDHPDVQMEF